MASGKGARLKAKRARVKAKAVSVATDDATLRGQIEAQLKGALDLEGLILQEGQNIRESSKVVYGSSLLDARLQFMALFNLLLNAKKAIPGQTDPSRSKRLTQIAIFIQGTYATETLISEGQYAKAAAALKQDYEILARVGEIKAGVDKLGKTPNARYAPGGGILYGELNKVAHPSNVPILEQLIGKLTEGDIQGVSPVPSFKKDIAVNLYKAHVYLLLEVTREAITLFIEMYPDDEKTNVEAINMWIVGFRFAEAGGAIQLENA